jgi:hypothetical protein
VHEVALGARHRRPGQGDLAAPLADLHLPGPCGPGPPRRPLTAPAPAAGLPVRAGVDVLLRFTHRVWSTHRAGRPSVSVTGRCAGR